MNTIVLSAFGTFGDYIANSSQIVAEELHGKVLEDYFVHSVIFPASIPGENQDRGAELLWTACSVRASGIISLGMASEKTGLCIETVARNLVDNVKYCPPELNGKSINHHRPHGEKVSLCAEHWNIDGFRYACLQDKIPVMNQSSDAGGFCCNHLAYQIVSAKPSSQNWMNTPSVFVHIPCSPESVEDPLVFASTGKVLVSVKEIIAGLGLLLRKAHL